MTENVENLNTQGIFFARDGDFEMAIACFKRAIQIEKDNAFLWFNLGITYRDLGEIEKAKESVKIAHEYDCNDSEISETLAILMHSCGNSIEALEICRDAILLDKTNPKLFNTSGVIFFEIEEFEKAASSFEMALSFSPFFLDALINLRDTYEELGNARGMQDCAERIKNLHGDGNYAR